MALYTRHRINADGNCGYNALFVGLVYALEKSESKLNPAVINQLFGSLENLKKIAQQYMEAEEEAQNEPDLQKKYDAYCALYNIQKKHGLKIRNANWTLQNFNNAYTNNSADAEAEKKDGAEADPEHLIAAAKFLGLSINVVYEPHDIQPQEKDIPGDASDITIVWEPVSTPDKYDVRNSYQKDYKPTNGSGHHFTLYVRKEESSPSLNTSTYADWVRRQHEAFLFYSERKKQIEKDRELAFSIRNLKETQQESLSVATQTEPSAPSLLPALLAQVLGVGLVAICALNPLVAACIGSIQGACVLAAAQYMGASFVQPSHYNTAQFFSTAASAVWVATNPVRAILLSATIAAVRMGVETYQNNSQLRLGQ